MSRPSEFPADTFVAAAGRGVHLLRQRPPGGGGDGAFNQVVVEHSGGVGAARWNRNNKVVASGCGDGQVQLLYSSGQVMAVLPRDGATRPADLGAITALSWSGGSKRLAAGTDRGSVFVFDMAQQNAKLPPTELPGHLGGVTAVEYQHEDKFLAVASGGGSVTLYSEPHRTGPAGAVPLHPAADTSARLCLSVAAAGEPSVAAGSAAGGVTVWDVPTQRVREHYAEQHSGGVAALGFVPLRPGMLYSAGADGRVCLQDRQAGPGHVSAFSLGAPATALMVKEDHSLLGLGTADGVVLLYDPRLVRQPLHTLQLSERAPVTSLHWQHRYHALPGSRHRPAAAVAAPAGASAAAPAASRGPGPSRLGMPPAGSTAAAAPAAEAAAAPAPSAAAPAASAAASYGAAAASIGSHIPAAAAPTPAAAAPAEPAGDAPGTAASRPAAGGLPASSASAVRAKLAADAMQLHPLRARHWPAGDAAADGRRTSMSAPGSRAMSPAAEAAAAAAAEQCSASSQATASQLPAAAATPAAGVAAGSGAGALQITPLHRPPAAAAQGATSSLAVTPLPGMEPRHDAAPPAAEVTPVQQQPLRGAVGAADVAQRLQQLGITPLGSSAASAAALQQQHSAQQAAAPSPLEHLAAAPVDLNITPLVAPPAGRQPAAAAASGRRPAAAAPPPLDVTPLAGGAAAADRRAQLCISPLPGMASEPQAVGSASPKGRSVLAERTNSGRASPGAVPLASGRRSALPRLASPLPAAPEAEQLQLHGSPSFAENDPLPLPGAGGQQPGGAAAGEKLKAAAADAQAEAALAPAGSGATAQWTIPSARGDAEMADAAGSGAAAAGPASHPLEFSFAAAQRSLEQLSSGAAGEGAAALPPGLRDDILALHWDMLQQFQAQQACMGQLVSQVLERNEALSAEVAALRKQLAQLTGRRDQFLWL